MVAADTFAALGEPNRLRIVELLRSRPHAVGEIADALAMRQPQVSKHLRVLGVAGLVAAEADHRLRIYRLEADRFNAIGDWVDSFAALWDARLDALGEVLGAMTEEERHGQGAR